MNRISEIEEEFYKEFNIKSREDISLTITTIPPISKPIYPLITDRILLELICLLVKYDYFTALGEYYSDIKEQILRHCITTYRELKLVDKEAFFLNDVHYLFE